jgi:hypothetical protein
MQMPIWKGLEKPQKSIRTVSRDGVHQMADEYGESVE